MRRAKAELMKSAIDAYLKRRRYAEDGREQGAGWDSAQQLAVAGAVEREVSRGQSFSFSFSGGGLAAGAQAEQQFSRLRSWVAQLRPASAPQRHELAALLGPLLAHLHLELLGAGHAEAAADVLARHQALLEGRDSGRRLLEELLRLRAARDLEAGPHVRAFRAAKYRLRLCTRALAALRRFLAQHSLPLLLHVLHKWFDLEVVAPRRHDEEEEEEEEDEDDGWAPAAAAAAGGGRPAEERREEGEEDDAMRRVLEAIGALEEQQPAPLLLYVVGNVLRNSCRLYSAKADDSTRLLAAALNNTVRLWGLSEGARCAAADRSSVTLRTEHYPPPSRRGVDAAAATTLRGHSAPVQDVTFAPGGALLLSASQDATMRAWRVEGGRARPVAAYRGHNHPVWSVDVSSVGLFAATGSRDRTARVWTLERNFPLRTCAGHHLDVQCVKFHPNNLYLATGSADKTVKLWSVNDARLLRLFLGHRGAVRALAFSPDGKLLASAAEDRRVRVWDLTAGRLFRELEGHASAVLSVAWDRANRRVASCSTDGTVREWDAGGGGLLSTYTVGAGVYSVQYSASDTLVCVAVS